MKLRTDVVVSRYYPYIKDGCKMMVFFDADNVVSGDRLPKINKTFLLAKTISGCAIAVPISKCSGKTYTAPTFPVLCQNPAWFPVLEEGKKYYFSDQSLIYYKDGPGSQNEVLIH